jgi:hypothetical protein
VYCGAVSLKVEYALATSSATAGAPPHYEALRHPCKLRGDDVVRVVPTADGAQLGDGASSEPAAQLLLLTHMVSCV